MTRLAFNYVILTAVLLSLSSSGCRHHYIPDLDRILTEEFPPYRSSNSVSLLNGHSPITEESILFTRVTRVYGNLFDMTEAAIQVAARELQRRGMTISPDGSRSLTLSVNEVEFGGTNSTIHTNVSMHVESGNGSSQVFVGKNWSVLVGSLDRQIDGAIMRAVVAMLSDPEVISYLTNKSHSE